MPARNEPEWSRRQAETYMAYVARGDSRPCKPVITHQTAGSGSGSKLICVVHDRVYSARRKRCSFPRREETK